MYSRNIENATRMTNKIDHKETARAVLTPLLSGASMCVDIDFAVPVLAEALDRAERAEAQEKRFWGMLCEASDALGGPTPEKAPHIASWITRILRERDEARAKLAEARGELRSIASSFPRGSMIERSVSEFLATTEPEKP